MQVCIRNSGSSYGTDALVNCQSCIHNSGKQLWYILVRVNCVSSVRTTNCQLFALSPSEIRSTLPSNWVSSIGFTSNSHLINNDTVFHMRVVFRGVPYVRVGLRCVLLSCVNLSCLALSCVVLCCLMLHCTTLFSFSLRYIALLYIALDCPKTWIKDNEIPIVFQWGRTACIRSVRPRSTNDIGLSTTVRIADCWYLTKLWVSKLGNVNCLCQGSWITHGSV